MVRVSREYGPAAQVAWAWLPGRRADVRCTGRAKYSAWRAPGRAGLRGANLGALHDASFLEHTHVTSSRYCVLKVILAPGPHVVSSSQVLNGLVCGVLVAMQHNII